MSHHPIRHEIKATKAAGGALARMTEHPERVATERSVTVKVATAAANAAVATLVKRGLERAVARLMDDGAAAPNRARSRSGREAS